MWFLCCMSTCATYSSLKADLRFEHTCKSPFQPFPCVPLSKSDTGVHSQRLVSDTIEPLLNKEQLISKLQVPHARSPMRSKQRKRGRCFRK